VAEFLTADESREGTKRREASGSNTSPKIYFSGRARGRFIGIGASVAALAR